MALFIKNYIINVQQLEFNRFLEIYAGDGAK